MRRTPILLCVVLISSTAYAQPALPPPEEPAPGLDPEEAQRDWTVGVGVGVLSFTGSAANTFVDIGPAYEVRAGFRTQRTIGFEAAYIGSTQSISALGIDPRADIRSHGVEALARFNLASLATTELGPMQISPFVVIGAAFQRFRLIDAGFNTSDIANDDNVFAIPVGAGVAGLMGRLHVDARFVWRRTFDNDMFTDPTDARVDDTLSHWSLSARAAVAF